MFRGVLQCRPGNAMEIIKVAMIGLEREHCRLKVRACPDDSFVGRKRFTARLALVFGFGFHFKVIAPLVTSGALLGQWNCIIAQYRMLNAGFWKPEAMDIRILRPIDSISCAHMCSSPAFQINRSIISSHFTDHANLGPRSASSTHTATSSKSGMKSSSLPVVINCADGRLIGHFRTSPA